MAKRDKKTNLAAAAKILGKKGGPARARSLTGKRRSEIAAQGGKAKARQENK
jgi:hypothetical protein